MLLRDRHFSLDRSSRVIIASNVSMNLILSLTAALVCIQAQDKGAAKPPVAPLQTAVVAKIDGKPILASELESLLWDWFGSQAISEITLVKLVEAEAKRIGVAVDPADVNVKVRKDIDAIKAQLEPGKNLDDELRLRGVTPSRLYMRHRTEMLADAIATKQFSPASFVKVSTIIVKPESEQATAVARAIQQAEEAFGRLQKKELWETVLAAYVQDDNIKRVNGLLGWRSIEAFPAVLQAEMRAAKVGQITKPVQTVNGIQIFRIETIGKEARGKDFEELKNQYLASAIQSLVANLKMKAKVEVLLPKFKLP